MAEVMDWQRAEDKAIAETMISLFNDTIMRHFDRIP